MEIVYLQGKRVEIESRDAPSPSVPFRIRYMCADMIPIPIPELVVVFKVT